MCDDDSPPKTKENPQRKYKEHHMELRSKSIATGKNRQVHEHKKDTKLVNSNENNPKIPKRKNSMKVLPQRRYELRTSIRDKSKNIEDCSDTNKEIVNKSHFSDESNDELCTNTEKNNVIKSTVLSQTTADENNESSTPEKLLSEKSSLQRIAKQFFAKWQTKNSDVHIPLNESKELEHFSVSDWNTAGDECSKNQQDNCNHNEKDPLSLEDCNTINEENMAQHKRATEFDKGKRNKNSSLVKSSGQVKHVLQMNSELGVEKTNSATRKSPLMSNNSRKDNYLQTKMIEMPSKNAVFQFMGQQRRQMPVATPVVGKISHRNISSLEKFPKNSNGTHRPIGKSAQSSSSQALYNKKKNLTSNNLHDHQYSRGFMTSSSGTLKNSSMVRYIPNSPVACVQGNLISNNSQGLTPTLSNSNGKDIRYGILTENGLIWPLYSSENQISRPQPQHQQLQLQPVQQQFQYAGLQNQFQSKIRNHVLQQQNDQNNSRYHRTKDNCYQEKSKKPKCICCLQYNNSQNERCKVEFDMHNFDLIALKKEIENDYNLHSRDEIEVDELMKISNLIATDIKISPEII